MISLCRYITYVMDLKGNEFLSVADYNPYQCGSANAKLITIKQPGLMKTKP